MPGHGGRTRARTWDPLIKSQRKFISAKFIHVPPRSQTLDTIAYSGVSAMSLVSPAFRCGGSPVGPRNQSDDPMTKLTKQAIDNQQPGTKDIFMWDTSPAGFGVRVRPNGTKSFLYSYRLGGGRSAPKKRRTIGKYGNITLEQARKVAQQWAGRVAAGGDPVAERNAQRLEREREACTVSTVADEFIEKYAKPRNRSWWEYQRILERYVKPRLGQVAIHKVTRKEIAGLLDRVANENGEVMSDRVLAVLRKLCRWQEARDDEFRSPIVAGMARTRPRDLARDRILSDEEIRAIWSALDQEAYPFAPIVKMLFYTAQRRLRSGGSPVG